MVVYKGACPRESSQLFPVDEDEMFVRGRKKEKKVGQLLPELRWTLHSGFLKDMPSERS